METLFSSGDLAAALAATAKKVTQRLAAWDADALLSTPDSDIVDALVEDGTVTCPVLLRDDAWMPPPTEVTHQVHNPWGISERRVARLVLVVPYEGERVVFQLRPNRFGFNPPIVLALKEAELHVAVDNPSGDAAAIRALFDRELDKIEEYLSWSRNQIEEHNKKIREEIPVLVSRRRAELLAIRNLQADIGFRIHRRADADTYVTPVKRRQIRPVRTTSTRASEPFRPEPVLADADYQAALSVIRHARNSLERTPSVAAKLSEEEIRNLLLVSLNAQFQGDAAGEVFNGSGKTDILIRVEDRNIFIGECKIWAGPSTADEALTQLFGYLVWRDTKAALLLFIRNRDVSAVIEKAVQQIEKHANYKRRGPRNDDDQIDFVMHADGDPHREIHLALLPFALRPN